MIEWEKWPKYPVNQVARSRYELSFINEIYSLIFKGKSDSAEKLIESKSLLQQGMQTVFVENRHIQTLRFC